MRVLYAQHQTRIIQAEVEDMRESLLPVTWDERVITEGHVRAPALQQTTRHEDPKIHEGSTGREKLHRLTKIHGETKRDLGY